MGARRLTTDCIRTSQEATDDRQGLHARKLIVLLVAVCTRQDLDVRIVKGLQSTTERVTRTEEHRNGLITVVLQEVAEQMLDMVAVLVGRVGTLAQGDLGNRTTDLTLVLQIFLGGLFVRAVHAGFELDVGGVKVH